VSFPAESGDGRTPEDGAVSRLTHFLAKSEGRLSKGQSEFRARMGAILDKDGLG
jgi:hypothetical protein